MGEHVRAVIPIPKEAAWSGLHHHRLNSCLAPRQSNRGWSHLMGEFIFLCSFLISFTFHCYLNTNGGRGIQKPSRNAIKFLIKYKFHRMERISVQELVKLMRFTLSVSWVDAIHFSTSLFLAQNLTLKILLVDMSVAPYTNRSTGSDWTTPYHLPHKLPFGKVAVKKTTVVVVSRKRLL